MIPNPVYENILFASNFCHGAELVRGKKTYVLKKQYGQSDSPYVQATLRIHTPTDAELKSYQTKGYDIYPDSPHSKPFAAKVISLSMVPDSEVKEWKQWDEY